MTGSTRWGPLDGPCACWFLPWFYSFIFVCDSGIALFFLFDLKIFSSLFLPCSLVICSLFLMILVARWYRTV